MNFKLPHFILLSIVWHLLCLTAVEIKPANSSTEKGNLNIDFLGAILRQEDIAFSLGKIKSSNITKERVKLKDLSQDWDFRVKKDKPEVFMHFRKKLPKEFLGTAFPHPMNKSDKTEERIRLELNPDD